MILQNFSQHRPSDSSNFIKDAYFSEGSACSNFYFLKINQTIYYISICILSLVNLNIKTTKVHTFVTKIGIRNVLNKSAHVCFKNTSNQNPN